MLIPSGTNATRLAFEPREKSDVVRGCTLLCALGDSELTLKVEQLKRLRGAFTHLLVLADVPVAGCMLDAQESLAWPRDWPVNMGTTRDRSALSALAVRNIELLGSLGFELHLALFNSFAYECGVGSALGAIAGGDRAAVSAPVLYQRQLMHEIQFVRWLFAQPYIKHITGILPCFGGTDAAAGDFTQRLVGDIKGCGYAGSILHNLGGEARTLFGQKLRRAGVLSVCDIRNEGEWLRTSCDIRSAIGFVVPPAHVVATVRSLCENPGAVGYYMDFGADTSDALLGALLVAAGAKPSKAQEEPLPQVPASATAAEVAQGGPSEAETPLWKPMPDGASALLRLPDIDTGLPVPVENMPCVLCSHGTTVLPSSAQRAVHRGVPVVAYVFDTQKVTGPATLFVARSDASVFTFDVADVGKREYLKPTIRNISALIAPQRRDGLIATPQVQPGTEEAIRASATAVVEDLTAGRLTIPTAWYTRRPLTVSYVYSINGAKRLSIAARETSPGVFDIGTPISEASHPVGTQPNVWILKFEPGTVVDGAAMVHEVGSNWYVYVENGKPRDR